MPTSCGQTADNEYELGTDTFFVRDGKIAVRSFAAKTTRTGSEGSALHSAERLFVGLRSGENGQRVYCGDCTGQMPAALTFGFASSG